MFKLHVMLLLCLFYSTGSFKNATRREDIRVSIIAACTVLSLLVLFNVIKKKNKKRKKKKYKKKEEEEEEKKKVFYFDEYKNFRNLKHIALKTGKENIPKGLLFVFNVIQALHEKYIFRISFHKITSAKIQSKHS